MLPARLSAIVLCAGRLGQLPAYRLRPGIVFENVGVDYAGPVLVKSGRIRRLVITKAYIAIFVSFSVKAMHIEPALDLSTEGFIATLHRFIARCGNRLSYVSGFEKRGHFALECIRQYSPK